MKTVIFIQVLYILINFEAINYKVNGAQKCESIIETRAVLLSCPEKDTGCDDDDPLSKATQADEYRLLQVNPNEMKRVKAEIQKEFPNRVTECKRKLVITMKLNNKGKIACDDGFIVIDHVYDPITRGKARLLSPVIIKLRQEQMVQLYPLQFQKIVNSNPNENIFTKDACSTYKGCSVDLDNPTCGITTYDGEPIPFSEGFCCSCDPYVNAMREVLPDEHENAFRYKDPRLFGHKKNRGSRNAETMPGLVNPNLLNLRAGGKEQRRHSLPSGDEEDNASTEDDPSGNPPSFFFDKDRQILTAPNAMIKELCKLDDKDERKDYDESSDDDSDSFENSLYSAQRSVNGASIHNGTGETNEQGKNVQGRMIYGDNDQQYKRNGSSGHHKIQNGQANLTSSDGEGSRESLLDGMRRYMDALDSENGGEYQFTGDKKFLARPMKNENPEIKGIEIMHGKRENGNIVAPSRKRKKRLIRDSDAYNLSLQYPTNPKTRRNKRIPNGENKKSNDKQNEKFSEDPCSEDLPPCLSPTNNCTFPVFFFTHDRDLLCPPCPAKKNCTEPPQEADDTTECEETKMGEESESEGDEENEMEADSEGMDVGQQEEAPPQQQQQPSPGEKVTRLHTNTGAMWDVNANVKSGNLFRLDLTKNDGKDGKQIEHEDSIEEIQYEKKGLPQKSQQNPNFMMNNQNLRLSLQQGRIPMAKKGVDMYGQANGQRGKETFNEGQKYPQSMMGYDPKMRQPYNTQAVRVRVNEYPQVDIGGMVQREQVPEHLKVKVDMSNDMTLRNMGYGDARYPTAGSANNFGGSVRIDNLKMPVTMDNKNMYGYQVMMDQSRKNQGMNEDSRRFHNRPVADNPWKSYYPHPGSWQTNMNGGYYPNDVNGRESIVDLLADSYSPNDDSDSQYFVSSQNVFFADNKPHRSVREKSLSGFDQGPSQFYDESSDVIARLGPERDVPDPFAKGDDGGDAAFFKDRAKISDARPDDYINGLNSKNEDEGLRNRRGARDSARRLHLAADPDPAPFGDYQKLRNAQFVRARRKRAAGAAPRQEQTVKISKWEHRTPPGPEYQFDVSKLTRPRFDRPVMHSSGGGDRQSFSDIQMNFAKLKPRSADQDNEAEMGEKILRMKIDRERLMQSYLTSPTKFKRDVNNDMKGKRHAKTVRRQERGGQDCSEGPPKTTTVKQSDGTDKNDSSKDSTHCLKLSDLWYSVYLIKRPQLAQLIGVQIYDKQTMCDGTTNWRDVTKGYMIRLGSFLQRAQDETPTISMTFTPTGSIENREPQLDTENYRLLIPSYLANEKKSSLYPEFFGGPNEFMLVKKEEISETGADCNKIGTSFEAFVRQPDRCSKPPGSCLKRQPVDLWRDDMEARIRGKRGKYFIENFGSVANTSIKSYANLSGDFLAMDYFGEYKSILEIEMRADGNAIVRQGENAQIPTVYIDSISPRKTKIVLSVMNMGLTSSMFRPRLGDCPSNLDPSWCPLEGPLVMIPPQKRHDFKLELSGVLPAKKVYCAVEILNHYNKKVAKRKIIMKKADRCFCAFYCKCVCLAGNTKTPCIQLSMDEYNAAGYFDPIPQRNLPTLTGAEAFFKNLKLVLISMANSLLVLGLIKAVVGLFWRRLGIFGVQVIVGPRTLCQYYESEISCCQVIYDECGFPIHPTTCKPVQIVPRWLEMFINLFFFYLYFLRVIWLLIKSSPCCKSCSPDCDSCSKFERSNECAGAASSKPSGVTANYFTYNVMTLSSKKPKLEESSLYNPYKADEDPLEADDTEFVLEEIKRYKSKNCDE